MGFFDGLFTTASEGWQQQQQFQYQQMQPSWFQPLKNDHSYGGTTYYMARRRGSSLFIPRNGPSTSLLDFALKDTDLARLARRLGPELDNVDVFVKVKKVKTEPEYRPVPVDEIAYDYDRVEWVIAGPNQIVTRYLALKDGGKSVCSALQGAHKFPTFDAANNMLLTMACHSIDVVLDDGRTLERPRPRRVRRIDRFTYKVIEEIR